MASQNTYPAIIVATILLFLALVGIDYPTTTLVREAIPFETQYLQDENLELGDEQTTQSGSEGAKKIEYRHTGTFFEYMFSMGSMNTMELSSQIYTQPVAKVVSKGALRYQYMVCSDDTYSHYTDEQFSDPSVGFTSKSDDSCAKDSQGYKLRLSKTIPQSQPVYFYAESSGGGAICSDGWRSYSTGRGTCSQHGGVSRWL